MCENHKKKFVQVHCHSSFSQLDGASNVDKLVKKAKEYGHPALALTDHGSPAGLFTFAKECKKNDIKPILGLEFYITNDLRKQLSHKDRLTVEDKDFHQSIYIKDKEGYKNFNYLTYMSFTDGYYYKPRIDFDLLFDKKSGLMCTSSCMASKTSSYILNEQHKDAEDLFKKFLNKFGDDFYGEIQFNEVEGQKKINDFIIHLCKKYDVPILIGGDVHYANPNDNVLQDALIRSKRDNDAGSDWVISARKLYFHDTSDYMTFNKELGWNYDEKFLEDCFENSIKFSEKVNFEFETGKYHLPKIKTNGLSSKEYIEKATWEGITKNIQTARKYFPNKYSNEDIEKIEKQVEYELKVIDDLGLNDYLLMVHDIINWEKNNGFYVGPGRGSAAASVVSWALGITGLDPLEHGLLFERFINPERKVMADIDWDSEAGARDHVLKYLIDVYGQESVSNVATVGTFGPKSALQAMSRGLRKETGQDSILMRKITKLDGLEKTEDLIGFFKSVREKTSDEQIIDWIDNNQDTIDFAQRIQGQMTQLGVHAGGIVVTPGPIYNYIPVTRGNGNLITAFREADGSSKDLSEMGIMKLDVLGLSTLNILKECVQSIKADKNLDLTEKIWYLDLEDKNVLNYFATDSPYGIFQMDRAKMFTDKIKVDSFKDIVAINAINRPGPLEKFLNKYGYWKAIDKGEIKVSEEELEKINKERYPFPFMEKVLSSTYGCLLYQEQLMLLTVEAAGFNLGESDNFRRGIAWLTSNPKYYTVAKLYEKLGEEMEKKGYTKEDTDKFVQYCRDFAGYSFNIAHSTTYAYIAFQTLYFKCYYPAYFFTAMINMENDIDKIQEIITEAKQCNIKILPHSITKSRYKTTVETDDSIRLGFGMIKGMGESVFIEMENLKLHECNTIHDVLKKPFKKINTTQLQNLIDIGAFDDFNIDREKINELKELYQDDTIENWFTRKRQTLRLETIPKTLSKNFDSMECLKIAMRVRDEEEPWRILVSELVKTMAFKELNKEKYLEATVKKQNELFGFSLLSTSKISEYVSSFKVKGILPVTEVEDEDNEYYFNVEKIALAKTKTGKDYMTLSLSDGKKTVKAKCWRKIDLIEGKVFVGKFKKDNFGLTLKDNTVYKID